MPQRRWFDAAHPQTLQIAVILLYINAALTVLFMIVGAAYFIPTAMLLVAEGVAANGIANSERWGYVTAVAASVIYLMLTLVAWLAWNGGINVFGLLFSVALVALLLHPMTRGYERVWFH